MWSMSTRSTALSLRCESIQSRKILVSRSLLISSNVALKSDFQSLRCFCNKKAHRFLCVFRDLSSEIARRQRCEQQERSCGHCVRKMLCSYGRDRYLRRVIEVSYSMTRWACVLMLSAHKRRGKGTPAVRALAHQSRCTLSKLWRVSVASCQRVLDERPVASGLSKR